MSTPIQFLMSGEGLPPENNESDLFDKILEKGKMMIQLNDFDDEPTPENSYDEISSDQLEFLDIDSLIINKDQSKPSKAGTNTNLFSEVNPDLDIIYEVEDSTSQSHVTGQSYPGPNQFSDQSSKFSQSQKEHSQLLVSYKDSSSPSKSESIFQEKDINVLKKQRPQIIDIEDLTRSPKLTDDRNLDDRISELQEKSDLYNKHANDNDNEESESFFTKGSSVAEKPSEKLDNNIQDNDNYIDNQFDEFEDEYKKGRAGREFEGDKLYKYDNMIDVLAVEYDFKDHQRKRAKEENKFKIRELYKDKLTQKKFLSEKEFEKIKEDKVTEIKAAREFTKFGKDDMENIKKENMDLKLKLNEKDHIVKLLEVKMTKLSNNIDRLKQRKGNRNADKNLSITSKLTNTENSTNKNLVLKENVNSEKYLKLVDENSDLKKKLSELTHDFKIKMGRMSALHTKQTQELNKLMSNKKGDGKVDNEHKQPQNFEEDAQKKNNEYLVIELRAKLKKLTEDSKAKNDLLEETQLKVEKLKKEIRNKTQMELGKMKTIQSRLKTESSGKDNSSSGVNNNVASKKDGDKLPENVVEKMTLDYQVEEYCPTYKTQILEISKLLKNLEVEKDDGFSQKGLQFHKKDQLGNWSKFWVRTCDKVTTFAYDCNVFYATKKIQLSTNTKEIIENRMKTWKQNPNFYQEQIFSLNKEIGLLEYENDALTKQNEALKLDNQAQDIKKEFQIDIKGDSKTKEDYICSVKKIKEDCDNVENMPENIKELVRNSNMKNLELRTRLRHLEDQVKKYKAKEVVWEKEKEREKKNQTNGYDFNGGNGEKRKPSSNQNGLVSGDGVKKGLKISGGDGKRKSSLVKQALESVKTASKSKFVGVDK